MILALGLTYIAKMAPYNFPKMPTFESLYKSKFLSTESKAFWKSMKAKNVLRFIDFLFLRSVHKTKTWSIQEREARKPFCFSIRILFFSR